MRSLYLFRQAPVVHLGGITTGRWARELEPDGPNVMSWALHNHWMVNFQSQQRGEIPLRYRLTTHDGPCDDLAATRFAREQAAPVVALRDRSPLGESSGQGMTLATDGDIQLTHVKPADFSDGVIMRLQNLSAGSGWATLTWNASALRVAWLTSPDEIDAERIEITGSAVTIAVAPHAIQSVRLIVG